MKKHSFIFVIFTLIFTIISCQPTTTVIVIDSSASQDTSESVNEISLSDGNWQYTQNVTLAEQEVTNIVLSNSIAGIVYRDKIEIINL